MSTDMDALLLDPIYELEGLAAQFVSRDGEWTADLTVIDKIAGVEIPEGGVMLQAKRPAACVRVSELEDNELDARKLKGGKLSFNSSCWSIEATRPQPVPGGRGELLLFLQERADD